MGNDENDYWHTCQIEGHNEKIQFPYLKGGKCTIGK